MRERPRVSVLMPTYNYARYLPEAIESVLNQNFEDFELIIADDASHDDTADVCAKYAEEDGRVTFIRHDVNLGMVENWNWCLERARGAFIKFLMADDKLNTPHTLASMVSSLDQRPDAVLVTTGRAIIDEASRETACSQPLGQVDCVRDFDWYVARYIDRDAKFINSIGEPSSLMFRREAGLRGFDPAYRQLVDLEMWLHLLQSGRMVYLAEPLCCFRRHTLQQTEVNKAGGLHHREELLLCMRYSHENARKAVLFRKMHRIAKTGRVEHRGILALVRKQFSPLEYMAHLTRYRLSRPFENLWHSAVKRCSSKQRRGECAW